MNRMWTIVGLTALLVSSGCSRDDDAASVTSSSTSTSDSGPASTTAATSDDADSADGGGANRTTSAPPSNTATVAPTSSPTTADAAAPTTTTPITVAELEEVGTPGLDSNDAFCAAWSRFAGSFQVVAVTAAFGSGPPQEVAALEVAAAPTVTAAYAELVEQWPDEIESERELAIDRSFGPFARRLDDASAALAAAGSDDAEVAQIADAWLAGLADRDPSTPEFTVDLPDDVWATIDEAAVAFADQRVPFSSDPSLVTDVATPLTDEYLATSCPDQGTLGGQEVGTP